jgi:alginate O-acetyltransferase complex protein AlgI
VYASPGEYYGMNLVIPTILFHLRVYCDFSAYSDIAIGAARVMGVHLSLNFDRPLFATSFRTFWQRWHMTLTRWVMDYLFKPLIVKVNHWGVFGRIFAIMTAFTVIGFWHGAAWGMILFGFLNGLLVASESVHWPWQRWMAKWLPNRLTNFLNGIFVFFVICLTVVCFAANSTSDLFLIYHHIFSRPFAPITMDMFMGDTFNMVVMFAALFMTALVEFAQKDKPLVSDWINQYHPRVRWTFYIVLLVIIFNFGVFSSKEYIYFQF